MSCRNRSRSIVAIMKKVQFQAPFMGIKSLLQSSLLWYWNVSLSENIDQKLGFFLGKKAPRSKLHIDPLILKALPHPLEGRSKVTFNNGSVPSKIFSSESRSPRGAERTKMALKRFCNQTIRFLSSVRQIGNLRTWFIMFPYSLD